MSKTLTAAAVCGILFSASVSFAAAPNGGNFAGGISRQESDIERGRRLEQRIHETPAPVIEQPAPSKSEAPSGPAVRVQTVTVEGSTLLSERTLRKVVAPFEGRTLTMDEMQQVADAVSDAYRRKGYVTSRAYIPVQSIKNGNLVIKVVEVKAGALEIRGNKYVKAAQLRRQLDVQPQGYFDFSALQRSLVYINEHPDRVAKAILVPGKEPGTTDVIIEVADQRPMHVGFEYNNYGSRFIQKNQYALTFEHNNLFGKDDMLFLKGQTSDNSRMWLEQVRYLFPLTSRFGIGVYALNSYVRLGKDFKDLDAIGKAQLFGLFATEKLIKNKDVDFRLNFGFDYKSLRDKLSAAEVSHDELRVVKAGFDLDVEDRWGRNILTAGMESGLTDIMGASEAKDPSSSRQGAGARFDKGVFTFFRLQPMPFQTSLLWKNTAQASNHNLPASEQFQIGGPLSVRGYAPAEFSGDSGIYSALELSLPIYMLSREIKIPFTKNEKLYDALRLVIFYDLATTHLNNPLASEQVNQTLRGYGFGIRLNIKDNVSLRVEAGYPQGNIKPSDHRSSHLWIECTVKY